MMGKKMNRREYMALVGGAVITGPFAARGQQLEKPPISYVADHAASNLLHVGWYELHPDIGLNFQLNRWAAMGGPTWIAEVRPVLSSLRGLNAWRDTFVRLGEVALAEDRFLHAALHFRCAEFFMVSSDPRKEPLRKRLLELFCQVWGVVPSACREVVFGELRMPAWSFHPGRSIGTLVVFGGFDSYIEELFPILISFKEKDWSVIAFEGPGQASVLEEQRVPLIRDWHGPVAAVLDAFNLQDVTLIGISLGGCLAIRAAAFEPRVRRVVAFDVLSDFFECMMAARPRVGTAFVRAMLAVGADSIIDYAISGVGQSDPIVEWGIAQACHVFGCERASQALRAAQTFHTRDVSDRVRQDVLLLAGAQDHYVPLTQLWEQKRLLSGARSISTRVFTAQEHAQAHCQVGNLPLAISTISDWARMIDEHRSH
jgi:alpha-beta hydrolase superfamily lysophospholipase